MSHCRQTWLSYFYKNLQLTFKNKTGFFYPGLLNHISVTHFCFTENCLNFDKLLTHHVKNCENSIFVSCFNNYCFHTFPWLLIMKNHFFTLFVSFPKLCYILSMATIHKILWSYSVNILVILVLGLSRKKRIILE